MSTKTIEMPDVSTCDATECAYNEKGACHARAITVGDELHPDCDTFLRSGEHCHRADRAGVGACKVKACKHNDDLECQAPAIRVGHREGRVECLTFTRR
jgi:hypothetical protein